VSRIWAILSELASRISATDELALVQNEMCELTKSRIRIAHISLLRLKMICRIDHILLMIDGEHSSPVHLHVDERLVTARKPKTINFLILPDKVSSIDSEGRSFGRVACDFHNREVLGVDPYFPLKQILVFAFRNRLQNNDTGRLPLPRPV
jgi:hypothetical protein